MATPTYRVDHDALEGILRKGHDSAILRCRLQFMGYEGTRRYVEPLVWEDRVYPSMLATQTSGRWSTTDPPLVNFPPNCIAPSCPQVTTVHMAHGAGCTGFSARDIVVPDLGWWWASFDFDAIEARLLIFSGGDEIDLRPLKLGQDIHTITASPLPIIGFPLPPNLKNPHTSPECEGWRQQLKWAGKEDRRRYLGKTVRYTLTYSKDAKALSIAKDIDKLNLRYRQLIEIGDKYLRLRPGQMAFKQRHWEEAARKGETRSFYGTRRKLFGSRDSIEKEGFSQVIQGTVADLMNLLLIDMDRRWPESRLVVNKHDGAIWAFPNSLAPDVVMPELRSMVIAERQLKGLTLDFPASFAIYLADGTALEG